jgi:hypothetical protein
MIRKSFNLLRDICFVSLRDIGKSVLKSFIKAQFPLLVKGSTTKWGGVRN